MDRYIPLKSNFTEKPVLLIDGQASLEDLHTCALQRIRAAADLLETLTCLSFYQADTKDTSHIVSALYLLIQDGCELLETAQFQTN